MDVYTFCNFCTIVFASEKNHVIASVCVQAFYWWRMHQLAVSNLDESISRLCPGLPFTHEMSKHVCMGV